MIKIEIIIGKEVFARRSIIEKQTDPENKKSQRVLEKCGFVLSGIIGEEGPRFYKEKDYL